MRHLSSVCRDRDSKGTTARRQPVAALTLQAAMVARLALLLVLAASLVASVAAASYSASGELGGWPELLRGFQPSSCRMSLA